MKALLHTWEGFFLPGEKYLRFLTERVEENNDIMFEQCWLVIKVN